MRWLALKLLWKIRLPNALPSLFAGMKVAIGLSLVGVLVGEFVSAQRGLGYVIMAAQVRIRHGACVRCDPDAFASWYDPVPHDRVHRATGDPPGMCRNARRPIEPAAGQDVKEWPRGNFAHRAKNGMAAGSCRRADEGDVMNSIEKRRPGQGFSLTRRGVIVGGDRRSVDAVRVARESR